MLGNDNAIPELGVIRKTQTGIDWPACYSRYFADFDLPLPDICIKQSNTYVCRWIDVYGYVSDDSIIVVKDREIMTNYVDTREQALVLLLDVLQSVYPYLEMFK
jgi:hypothetical protein